MSNTNENKLHEKLWDAAARGDNEAIRMLVMNGVDLEARNEDGFTAYNLATQQGHVNTALTILAARNMAYETKLGFTPANSLEFSTRRKSA